MLDPMKTALSGLLIALSAAPAVAEVQVLQIKDARITSSSPKLTDSASGVTGLGEQGPLCVVNTVPGRGVRLTFVPTNPPNSNGSWQLRNPQTGETLAYRQNASLGDGSGAKTISGAPGGQFIDIPASVVARSAAACPANGNLIKWIVLTSTRPTSGGEWTDNVTLQATSL